MAENGISQRAFARMIGVYVRAVQEAIESGRIVTLPNGKIDPVQAKRDWADNTDLSKGGTVIEIDDEIEATENEVQASGKRPSAVYAEARAKREEFNAKIAQMEYELAAGKLVDAARIQNEAFRLARITRDALLNIPNKIAHELAAEKDPHKIHTLLTGAITSALEGLLTKEKKK